MKKFILGNILLWGCLTVTAAEPDSVRYGTVHRAVQTIDDVVVTGARQATDIRKLPVTVSVVDRAQIEHATRTSVLPTLTEHVPGLFVTGRGVMGYGVSTGAAGGMSLRGIGSSPTTGLLVLIDGHPQYMGLMGHPIADACRADMAERVEVVRGPASMLYGSNAMGGVINIVTRQMRDEGVRNSIQAGYGSYNSVQTNLTSRIRKGRLTSVLTGSYDRTDGHRPRMGFDQYGGGLKLGYELSRRWSLTANGNITHFNAENPGTVGAPIFDNKMHITRANTSFSIDNRYEHTSGSLSLFHNQGRHRINDGYSAGEQPLDYRFHSRDRLTGISWYQTVALFRGNHTTFGVDYQHFGGKAWNRFLDDKPDQSLADVVMDEVAGYVDFRQAVAATLTLDAGVRVDHHSQAGTEWVPQFGLSWQAARHAQLKATVSKGFRFPTIREMYMFPPQNPDLKPERLWNYELAFAQQLLDGRIAYGVNLFYIDGRNLIQTVRTDGRPKNVNIGRVKNAGLELEMAWRPSRAWRVEANYSYLHMKYPVLAAPRNKLFVGAGYAGRRWSVDTGMQYIRGLFTSLTPEKSERQFLLWNLTARLRAARWCSLYVRGENLLAARYEINAGYPMPRATVLGGIELNF